MISKRRTAQMIQVAVGVGSGFLSACTLVPMREVVESPDPAQYVDPTQENCGLAGLIQEDIFVTAIDDKATSHLSPRPLHLIPGRHRIAWAYSNYDGTSYGDLEFTFQPSHAYVIGVKDRNLAIRDLSALKH